MSQQNDEDSVFDVLNIDELEDFKSALTLYGASRLESFYNAIQSAIDVLIELDQASEGADLYDTLYAPYYNKLQTVQTELDKRNAQIAEQEALMEAKTKRQREIQKILDFKTYMGDDYATYCLYRREQKYTNSNYISDGLSNTELIDRAKEFIEAATIIKYYKAKEVPVPEEVIAELEANKDSSEIFSVLYDMATK